MNRDFWFEDYSTYKIKLLNYQKEDATKVVHQGKE